MQKLVYLNLYLLMAKTYQSYLFLMVFFLPKFVFSFANLFFASWNRGLEISVEGLLMIMLVGVSWLTKGLCLFLIVDPTELILKINNFTWKNVSL